MMHGLELTWDALEAQKPIPSNRDTRHGLHFGASWAPLGRALDVFWVLLGASWALLGALGRLLGASWTLLGRSLASLGRLLGILDDF